MHADRETWARLTERRKVRRLKVKLGGTLFLPEESREIPCVILELSARGAGLRFQKASPPPKTKVVLYIDGFGRFEGVTTHPTKEGTGLRFDCTDRKRERLADQLESFGRESLAEQPRRS